MERNEQHIIDSKAKRLLHNVYPAEWVLREQNEDYGIDYEAEIFMNKQSTGIVYKIQLKGTENINFIENKTKISLNMKVKSLNYCLNEIKIPTFLVHIDVSNEIVYWHNLMVDNELRERLQKANNSDQDTIVVHIDPDHTLPKDIMTTIHEYNKAMFYMSAQYFVNCNRLEFINIAENVALNSEDIDQLKDKVDLLKINKIKELLSKNDLKTACSYLRDLLSSTDSTIETKFQALFFVEKIQIRLVREQEGPRSHDVIENIYFNSACAFLDLTKNGPEHLRIYSMVLLLSSKVGALARKEYICYINQKLNQDDEDVFWRSIVQGHRTDLVKKIQLFYMQFKRLINICNNKNLLCILPSLMCRFVPSFNMFLNRLREDNLMEAHDFYRKDIYKLLGFSLKISDFYNNEEELNVLCDNLALVSNVREKEKIEKEIQDIDLIIKDSIKDTERISRLQLIVKERIQELLQDFEHAHEKREPTLEEEKDLYYKMARSFGVNFDDPEDKIAQVVQIGIDDLNPGRILKNCQYLFVELTGGGLPARWFKLPTAGSKKLTCVKHKYAVESLALDSLYNFFEKEYCSKCKDKIQHPDDWEWTRAWQLSQNTLYLRDNP